MKRLSQFLREWYFGGVLALWVFSPGIRRLVDWQTSFHKVSVFSIIPLIAMLPGIVFIASRWRSLGKIYRTVFAIWCVAFGYGLLIGFASGSRVSALYDVVTFLFPALFGVFLSFSSDDAIIVFGRLSKTTLWLAAITGVYAIYQYVSPPPWDVYWVQNSELISIGEPVPFGLRVFGTLNAYGTFAHFLTIAMILNLPRFRLSNLTATLLYVPCIISLILTLDRTSWLACILGIAIYTLASPERKQFAGALTCVTLVGALASFSLLTVIKGSDTVTSGVQQRFSTLAELDQDSSVASRQQQTTEAFHDGLSEPLGQGLGQVGTSSVAGSSGSTTTLDNGYLSRFLELGFVGFAAYLIAVFRSVYLTYATFSLSGRQRTRFLPAPLAAILAIQLVFIVLDLSTDAHNSLLGILFWSSLFIASRANESLSATRGSARFNLTRRHTVAPV